MKHVLLISWICAAPLAISGCADGGRGGGPGGHDAGIAARDAGGSGTDSSVPRPDGGPQLVDAGRDSGLAVRDAGIGVRDAGRDAGSIIPGVDAGPIGGLTCTTSADCAAMPGTCCLGPPLTPMGVCAPGMDTFGVCLPSG